MYFDILKLRIHRVKNRGELVDRKCIHSESIGLITALDKNIKDCKVNRYGEKSKNNSRIIGKNNNNNTNKNIKNVIRVVCF